MIKKLLLKKALFLLLLSPISNFAQTEIPNLNMYKGSFSSNLRSFELNQEQTLKNIPDWFQLSSEYSFEEINSNTDNLNITHRTFQQYFNGIEIDGAILMLHSKEGKVLSINGQVFNLKDIDTSVSISQEEAMTIGKNYLNVSSLIQEYPTETVFAKIPTENSYIHKLVHQVRIDSNQPFELCYLFIDVETGKVLNKVNLYANEDIEGTAHTKYEGEKTITFSEQGDEYILQEDGRGIQTYNATDGTLNINGYTGATNYTNSSTTWQLTGDSQAALDVHWGMEMTYDFYLDVFDRDSFDGNGHEIKQYINPPELQENPNNAAALGAPYNIMIYGLGNGTQYDHFTKLDVEGHEFTHLVVGSNGNGGLVYQGESGALNESFADIFGICIEFFANGESSWLIGDGVFLNGSYMRSMSNPNAKQHPDTYRGNFWIEPSNIGFDNGGVHINSSIQNYWFYLLVNGGSGTNDNGDFYDVKAIGLESARSIAFRNLINYVSPNALFYEAFQGSLQATSDLFGEDSEEYQSVIDAWFAVGIYEGMEQPCSGMKVLEAPSETFSDGSGNGNYVDNSTCEWLINPENAAQLQLDFSEMDLEFDYDFIYVYDGPNEDAPLLGEYTGSEIPDPIVTTPGNGTMFVKFVSDPYVNGTGWEATYTILSLNVEEVDFSKYLKVFPNPTNGMITIDSKFGEEIEVVLRDMLGRTVTTKKKVISGRNTIDFSKLEKGIYNLEFQTDKGSYSEKLIIQ
ncbi:M4 family metallopeptidase [Aureivirga sp. CE67]|uniref:M4 family metallopeptidase n=1 Tax=Aureivirga sp. CE67 TaxID=1788983 RepID=UPI0018CBEF41|nr:M4 family metallopeptidase [Aureivirga sp. CE67]